MPNYLITGGNSFLGKAVAEHLSKNGKHKLLVVTRSPIDKFYKDMPGIMSLDGIDLLNEAHLEKLAAFCAEFFNGRLNIINCVGYYKGQSPFEDTAVNEAKNIFESNFTTVYNTAYTLIPYLKKNNGGHFICFSCKSVKYRYPQMAAFSAAKSALDTLVGSLANEFSEYGLVANSFSLSTIDTETERIVKPSGDFDNWLKPEEIAILMEKITDDNFSLINGNTIDLFKYSKSFFGKSYFERIER